MGPLNIRESPPLRPGGAGVLPAPALLTLSYPTLDSSLTYT